VYIQHDPYRVIPLLVEHHYQYLNHKVLGSIVFVRARQGEGAMPYMAALCGYEYPPGGKSPCGDV
jgi:hypothetical protein